MRKMLCIFIPFCALLVVAVGAIRLLNPPDPIMFAVPVYCQNPDYPNGCESAALYMLLQFYGVDATMEDIVNTLPQGPVPYMENGIRYGANPEREFVGDPRRGNSYGVYNEPIRDVADHFKPGAKTKVGASIDDISAILKTGNPVIVWYTIHWDSDEMKYCTEWYDYETDEIVRYPAYEHAVVITGCDDSNFFYNDSNLGSTVGVGKDFFETVFNELGGRIVYYES